MATLTRTRTLGCGLLALGLSLVAVGCGSDKSSDDQGTGGIGASAGTGATGAVETTGGSSTGGVATGGNGATAGSGGAATGGQVNSGGTGGMGSGGTPSGGMSSGGTNSGGMSSGGTSSGGMSSGGTSSGGTSSGGTSSGGADTGGVGAIGGTETGGASGGAETGGAAGEPTGGQATMEWLPSWATTIQKTEERNNPPPLGGKTLRQFVWPTYPGSQVRIQLSNEKGDGPVEISKVHIANAQPLGSGAIDAATDAEFTFEGSASVTIPVGQTAWSDPLDFSLGDMQPTAISMLFGNSVPNAITGHPGARTTSYVANGDAVSQASVTGETRDRWYFINAIEVMAPADAFAIAALGDSITDGYGILNTFERWPDFLTIAISQDPQIADKVSVLDMGAGANNLLTSDGYMDPGVERVDRDILARPKVKWVIVLMGINDIVYGGAQASQVTAGYDQIVQKCHAANILVYGSPLTPCSGHQDVSDGELQVRNQVNQSLTSNSPYDALIDFAAAIADPTNPAKMQDALSNDWLHPKAAGYEVMGQAVDLSLFYDHN